MIDGGIGSGSAYVSSDGMRTGTGSGTGESCGPSLSDCIGGSCFRRGTGEGIVESAVPESDSREHEHVNTSIDENRLTLYGCIARPIGVLG